MEKICQENQKMTKRPLQQFVLMTHSTPLVIIALEHEIKRAQQFALACKDSKKRLFHQTVERTYQQILDAIKTA